MIVLPDGTYDVIVVEASEAAATEAEGRVESIQVSVTILAGPHKSEVVDLAISNRSTPGFDRPAFDLLGLPGTLTVTGGRPHLSIDS